MSLRCRCWFIGSKHQGFLQKNEPQHAHLSASYLVSSHYLWGALQILSTLLTTPGSGQQKMRRVLESETATRRFGLQKQLRRLTRCLLPQLLFDPGLRANTSWGLLSNRYTVLGFVKVSVLVLIHFH